MCQGDSLRRSSTLNVPLDFFAAKCPTKMCKVAKSLKKRRWPSATNIPGGIIFLEELSSKLLKEIILVERAHRRWWRRQRRCRCRCRRLRRCWCRCCKEFPKLSVLMPNDINNLQCPSFLDWKAWLEKMTVGEKRSNVKRSKGETVLLTLGT